MRAYITDVVCASHMSLKRSIHRRIYHGCGAGVDGLNASKLESEQELRSVLAGGACVGGGTLLSWNSSWLIRVDCSFPTLQDDRRCYESNASVHDCLGGFDQAECGTAE